MNHLTDLGLIAETIGRQPTTVVVLPSISLGYLTRRFRPDLDNFEETFLFHLFWLAKPNIELIFIFTEGFDKHLIDHSLYTVAQHLNTKQSSLRSRIQILTVPSSQEGLSASLYQSPQHLEQLATLLNHRQAVISAWQVGHYEISVAQELDCRLLSGNAACAKYDNKSAGRKLAQAAGVATAVGVEDIYSLTCAQKQMSLLAKQATAGREFILKLNKEDGGSGIGYLKLDQSLNNIEQLTISKNIPKAQFEQQLAVQGAVLEQMIVADVIAVPSIKLFISDSGEVQVLATHDQLEDAEVYLGVHFPANAAYRNELIQQGLKLAKQCCKVGIRGLFSIDFLAKNNPTTGTWQLYFLELNLRASATTHPYFWTKYLTGAQYNNDSGHLEKNGEQFFYNAYEHFQHPLLNTIDTQKIIRACHEQGLSYCRQKQTGVHLHMLSMINAFNRFGATIIGTSQQQIEELSTALNTLIQKLCEQTEGHFSTDEKKPAKKLVL